MFEKWNFCLLSGETGTITISPKIPGCSNAVIEQFEGNRKGKVTSLDYQPTTFPLEGYNVLGYLKMNHRCHLND